MDNPPPYDDNTRGVWPNEKPSKVAKSKQTSAYKDPQAENSARRGQLLLEGSQRPNDRIGTELVPVGNRVIELDDDFDASTEAPIQPSRSGAYFRPQATLDQPLDIDLDTYRRGVTHTRPGDTSGAGNQQLSPAERSTLASINPNLSANAKADFMFDKHPDMDVVKLFALFEPMESQNSGSRNSQLNSQDNLGQGRRSENIIARHTATVPVTRQRSLPRSQSDAITVNNEMAIRPSHQTAPSNEAMLLGSAQHNSLAPQHRRQKTATEQEEEDFQFALQLSQQDIPIKSSHSSSTPQIRHSSAITPILHTATTTRHQPGSTSIRVRGAMNQEPSSASSSMTTRSTQQDFSLQDSLNNSHASALSMRGNDLSPHLYAQGVAPIEPLPLFPGGVSATHLSRFSPALGPLANKNAEQQALSDSVAMYNLHAQRQADRILAERNHTHNLQSQPQNDRAMQAAIALARESLADSRLQTSLTQGELLYQRTQATRDQAANDALAHIWRSEELEQEKQQRMKEDALRKVEAAERRRALDQQRQREADERRRQEDEDARFAMELSRMQHEQTLEKVDAFSRAIQQPARRRPMPQLRRQTLEFSGHDTPSGSVREIAYSSNDDDHGRDDDQDSDYFDYNRDMQRRGR